MIRFKKMFGISIGDQCGEVLIKMNLTKRTSIFIANINGKTVAQGLIFDDVREALIEIFTPKKGVLH